MRCLFAVLPFGVTLLTACGSLPTRPAEPVYVDTAEVIQAEPLYQAVQVARPVNRCWTETVAHPGPRRNGYAAPIIGGMIGGMLGSKLGRGAGNTPLMVAGALAGAAIGQRVSAPAHVPPTYSNVQRCTTVNQYERRQQVVGYRVNYRYEGQTFTTQTRRHPGRFIRVRVNVDPVDGT
jgi:uncharacterized protein YcfJ